MGYGELTIEITKGLDNPTNIAVVPFAWKGEGLPAENVANIIGADLHRSGQFAPMPLKSMLSTPSSQNDVHFRDWRASNVEYLLIGQLEPVGAQIKAIYQLFDVFTQKSLLTVEKTVNSNVLRGLAHRISDEVYEKLTGIPGAFSTRLLYVSSQRQGQQFTYRLIIADIDGANEQVVLEQDEPILTPSWSPDAMKIAYVSFETSRPAIYIHDLRTGQRTQLTNFKGLNSSPAWSPDGNSMAMVLSKDGNPDVYVMNLATRQLKRLTKHYSIDTEPSWLPNGQSIIFTSDRGGKPQIYKVNVNSGKVERVTYEGRYNARARALPSGDGMVLVHQREKQYNIAIMDWKRNSIEVLTSTSLDESPSIAPNGTMLLYATKWQGKQILSAVSLDGGVKYNLPSRFGDVREPAWSPLPQN